MRPRGWSAASFAADASNRNICEKTRHSRIRRAITWVYCEPKSKMTTFSWNGRAPAGNLRRLRLLKSGRADDPSEFREVRHATYLLPIPTPCTVWKTFPSDLIEGAMMISVS